MGDEPQVTNGTRQPSGRIATDFHLNRNFVDSVGEDVARRFLEVLRDVARTHGHAARDEIAEELRTRVADIGVGISDVELDSFADEINRSERVMGAGEANPYDPGNLTRDE